jgi:radical SAM protein with 4Fe4S-binding SPASM domain
LNIPKHLLLQWHITNRCNQRCTHCYQEEYSGPDPDFETLLDVFHQFQLLLKQLSLRKGSPVRGHVTVTGGEPFLFERFFDLLEIFFQQRKTMSFSILTNGSCIDMQQARALKRLKPRFVQVSMEGGPETHDRIRGPGSYARTVQGIKLLVKQRIQTYISFTAHQENFKEFGHVAQEGRTLRVHRIWADRLIPCGQAEQQGMTPREYQEFLQIMHTERIQGGVFWRRKTEIAMHRALQFLLTGGRPYRCTAGRSLLAVMPDGDVYPCRRLPFRVGNLHQSSLVELYDHSMFLQELRNQKKVPKGCADCPHQITCQGGLKCLAYAIHRDPFAGDPSCWLRKV